MCKEIEMGTLIDVGSLTVRSAPGTSNTKLGTIYRGDSVQILEKECASASGYTWHKILFNGNVGYVVAGNNTPNFSCYKYWKTLLNDSDTNDDNGSIDVSGLIPVSKNAYLSNTEMQNNAKIIFAYLYNKGWSKNAICATIANLQAESTVNPGLWEVGVSNPGYGLAQWTPSTKWTNYADQYNYEYDNLYRQLDYLIYAIQPGQGEWLIGSVPAEYQLYSYEFTNSTYTPYKLAIVFLLCYERPHDQSESTKKYRGDLANDWQTFFTDLGWY